MNLYGRVEPFGQQQDSVTIWRHKYKQLDLLVDTVKFDPLRRRHWWMILRIVFQANEFKLFYAKSYWF